MPVLGKCKGYLVSSPQGHRDRLAESLVKPRISIFVAPSLHHHISGYHTGASLISEGMLEVCR